MAYVVPPGVPGLTPGTYESEAAARAASANTGVGGTLTPSQSYSAQLTGAYNQAYSDSRLGIESSARDGVQRSLDTLVAPDIAAVWRAEAERLGLTGISEQIAKMTAQSNKLTNTYEDLPDTIRDSTRDVGLSGALLDRRVAGEGAVITRSIKDLLQSVSVLGGQYDRGIQQADRVTSFANENYQNQRIALVDRVNAANQRVGQAQGLFDSIFGSLREGIITPAQQRQLDFEKQRIDQDESQFARTLAEQQRQFGLSLASKGGSGSKGNASAVAKLSAARTASDLLLSYGLNPNDEALYTAAEQAVTLYPGDRAKQDAYLKAAGIAPATIKAGSPTLSTKFVRGNADRSVTARAHGATVKAKAGPLSNNPISRLFTRVGKYFGG